MSVVPIQMLQCPRPYLPVMGSVGAGESGCGWVFAEASFWVASVGVVGWVVVMSLTDWAGVEDSLGQPTPTGQPMMPFCLA